MTLEMDIFLVSAARWVEWREGCRVACAKGRVKLPAARPRGMHYFFAFWYLLILFRECYCILGESVTVSWTLPATRTVQLHRRFFFWMPIMCWATCKDKHRASVMHKTSVSHEELCLLVGDTDMTDHKSVLDSKHRAHVLDKVLWADGRPIRRGTHNRKE